MKKLCFLLMLLMVCVGSMKAQRSTDLLGRGVVAVKVDAGVFVSWRIFGEEYYDVKYNLYRNGTKVNAQPLTVSNFIDTGGNDQSSYTVKAVVRGVEGAASPAAGVWPQYKYKLYTTCETGFFDIPLARVYDNNGVECTNSYIANDAEVADVDGDGVMEIILKRRCTDDDATNYTSRSDGRFDRIDCYKLDGTLLWWINVGPNMVSGGSHELNVVAYDWDGDGRAEVMLRGGDDMMVHGRKTSNAQWTSDKDWPQRIGTKGVDTRGSVTHTANMTYTNTGGEYLVYMDGYTGVIYDAVRYMTYPIPRGNASDWGDAYGHRSSKYFFGAPFLDGKNPSVFLGRGIYTKHEMRTFDVNPSTHALTERWHWSNNGGWSDPWYANGNHNFCIADVDRDGRDEIVYGSMVVDDNGHGLTTTGLGHGDALHCSDFDPYREGLEIFACNEEEPCMNYRNATTSKLYVRRTSTSDDGRALCANFSNVYPGAMGRSTQTGMISCVRDKDISDIGDYIAWSDLNFRIYFDGDLLSEVLNSPGTEREAAVIKPGSGRLFTSSGCKMNNWSKNHACFVGDIIGDWREEMILRVGEGHDAIRIYTTAMPTEHAIYTLWHDHQYRQAMVWQMMGYNQPPHLSYFLGELEGITTPPPPLTTTGRTWIGNNATIGTNYNGQHLLHNEYANTSLNVTNGASPYILTINVPKYTYGIDSYALNPGAVGSTTYTCNLNGGAMTGETRLIKQGLGILNMAAVTHTYTGETRIWDGTVNFNGTLQNSPMWMNINTVLNTTGGSFLGGLTMKWGARLNVGGANANSISTVNVGDLNLEYGAIVTLDINGANDNQHDKLNMNRLILDTSKAGQSNWVNFGPNNIVPVFHINTTGALASGMYEIGDCQEVEGALSAVKIECSGMDAGRLHLIHSNGKLYLGCDVDQPLVWDSQVGPGQYYLYNVGTGRFLTSGHNWGTHAALDDDGMIVTLAGGGGNYTVASSAYTNGYLGANAYMDNGTAATWTFTKVSGDSNTYTMKNDNNYLVSTSADMAELTTTAPGNNPAGHWQLVNRAMLVERLNDATPTNPIDASFYMTNARSRWGWNTGHGFAGTALSDQGSYREQTATMGLHSSASSIGQWHKTFDNYQRMTGVKNGTYRVWVKGFYTTADGYTSVPYLYANGARANLKLLTTSGVDDATKATQALRDDTYLIGPITCTVTDGTLQVGVKSDGNASWVTWRQFTIQCIGTTETAEIYAAYEDARNLVQQVGTLPYADPLKKPNLNINPETATEMREATQTLLQQLRAYVESNDRAEAVSTARDATEYITNANNPVSNAGWDITGSINNPFNNEPWTDSNGISVHSYFDGGNYNGNSWTTTMTQTINLPKGQYVFSVKARANANVNYTLSCAGQTATLPHVGNVGNIFNRGWGNAYMVIESTGDPVTITVNASADVQHAWFSISDFRLTQIDVGAQELARVKGLIQQAGTLPYADPAKKPNPNVNPTSDANAQQLAAQLLQALRAYYESNAAAENVSTAVDYSNSITNRNNPANNDGWTITGRMNNPFNNQPWTDANGENQHSYFDGGDWGNTSWTTTMEQTVNLPSGTFLLTAKGRAAAPVNITLSVNGESVDIARLNDQGNVFNNGWGDYYVVFQSNGSATINVTASANEQYAWFSVCDFRLVQIGGTGDRALAEVLAWINETGTLPYADQNKKPNPNVQYNTDEEAIALAAQLLVQLRAYIESNALAEGVPGAVNMTNLIVNPTEPTNTNGWSVTGANIGIRNDQPWTNADGGNVHSYFDGGDWANTSWMAQMEQQISLPAGRYLLTAKARSAEPVVFTLGAGGQTVRLPHIGDQGNIFDRGWNDAYVVFETAGNPVNITASATAEGIHSWLSISDFRLVQLAPLWGIGDVDHDGDFDYDDVNCIIQMIFGQMAVNQEADINNDGRVTLADVTMLITSILRK